MRCTCCWCKEPARRAHGALVLPVPVRYGPIVGMLRGEPGGALEVLFCADRPAVPLEGAHAVARQLAGWTEATGPSTATWVINAGGGAVEMLDAARRAGVRWCPFAAFRRPDVTICLDAPQPLVARPRSDRLPRAVAAQHARLRDARRSIAPCDLYYLHRLFATPVARWSSAFVMSSHERSLAPALVGIHLNPGDSAFAFCRLQHPVTHGTVLVKLPWALLMHTPAYADVLRLLPQPPRAQKRKHGA